MGCMKTLQFTLMYYKLHSDLLICDPQEYWSLLDGDEFGNWVDAHLTDVGRGQAQEAHDTWAAQIQHGIPSPQSYYMSTLHRTCETGQITFQGLDMPLTTPFRPLIKEVSETLYSILGIPTPCGTGN